MSSSNLIFSMPPSPTSDESKQNGDSLSLSDSSLSHAGGASSIHPMTGPESSPLSQSTASLADNDSPTSDADTSAFPSYSLSSSNLIAPPPSPMPPSVSSVSTGSSTTSVSISVSPVPVGSGIMLSPYTPPASPISPPLLGAGSVNASLFALRKQSGTNPTSSPNSISTVTGENTETNLNTAASTDGDPKPSVHSPSSTA